MTLDAILRGRGLLSVAGVAGWFPHERQGVLGWAYPVYNVAGQPYTKDGKTAHRWKAGDSSAKPKYNWLMGRPDGVRYYLLPGAVSAIHATGEVHIAAGEPDLLTLRAAGIHNALCWFDGEDSLPPTLLADLKLLGAHKAYYYPDRDETGERAAHKIMVALIDPEFSVTVLQQEGEPGSKHDLNWLWQNCGFDALQFEARRLALPPLHWEPEAPPPDENYHEWRPNTGDWYLDWINLIIDALGPPDAKEGRVSRWHCPLASHADKDPSFRISTDQRQDLPWPVCSCGIHTRDTAWEEVAAAVGMESSAEYKARRRLEDGGPLGSPDLSHPPDRGPQDKALNVDGVFTDSLTVINQVRASLRGEGETEVEPIYFPFNAMHQFGGFAHLMMPRKLVYILGVSGGGKTAFCEQLEANLRQVGHDSIWWGPEWSPFEMGLRALQRAGGVDFERMMLWQVYRADLMRGVPPRECRGLALGAAVREKALVLMDDMSTWPGKAHYVTKMSLSSKDLIATMRARVLGLREQGRKVSTLWFDYLQLWRSYGQPDDAYSMELAADSLKNLCADLDLVGFIVMQPRKDDSQRARDGSTLHANSSQGLSDQKCNLYITITPSFDSDGKPMELVDMRVVKNSAGRTGKLSVQVNWGRLMWKDAESSTAKVHISTLNEPPPQQTMAPAPKQQALPQGTTHAALSDPEREDDRSIADNLKLAFGTEAA